MSEWYSFFGAMAGAAATLTGLIFVALSINLKQILAISYVANRGLESIIILLNILIVSCLCLVPAQSLKLLGCEILVINATVWLLILQLDIQMLRKTDAPYKWTSKLNLFLSQLALAPYLISGAVILYCGTGGLYWLVAGFIFSFIKSIVDAWVLLIEIIR